MYAGRIFGHHNAQAGGATSQGEDGRVRSRNAEMERFVYTVSHELRTPLLSISGLLGYLKQDAEKDDLERMNGDMRIVNEAELFYTWLLCDLLICFRYRGNWLRVS